MDISGAAGGIFKNIFKDKYILMVQVGGREDDAV